MSCRRIGGNLDPEDLNITTLLSPSSMSHPEQYRDADWVEPADEPTGTAVFDATGDKTAMPSWDELVRQHADRVYRLAYRLSGNQHDAEDLTQETFIRVSGRCRTTSRAPSRAGCTASPPTCSWTWCAVAAGSGWRRCRRTTTGCPPTSPTPKQIYHDAHLGPDLQAALDSLPPEFRAAVVLCDIEGLSYEEIGATLGVKLGTVRSRIHRGRQALRDYLAAHSDHDALRAAG